MENAVQSDDRTFVENFGLEEIAPMGITPRKETPSPVRFERQA
jgi:hypothetical protein